MLGDAVSVATPRNVCILNIPSALSTENLRIDDLGAMVIVSGP